MITFDVRFFSCLSRLKREGVAPRKAPPPPSDQECTSCKRPTVLESVTLVSISHFVTVPDSVPLLATKRSPDTAAAPQPPTPPKPRAKPRLAYAHRTTSLLYMDLHLKIGACCIGGLAPRRRSTPTSYLRTGRLVPFFFCFSFAASQNKPTTT